MSSSPINIAIIQNAPDHAAADANRDGLMESALRASHQGAQLIVAPECATTGYAIPTRDETLALAEPLAGPTTRRVARLCSDTGCHVVYGFLERDGHDIYNTAVVIGPGGILGCHRKAHIAPVGADVFVQPGGHIGVIEAMGIKLGLSICYEVRFPELARCQALQGAQMLIVVANWPAGADVNPDFMAPARAAENNLPLIAANRCGRDGPMTFLGKSAVYLPTGHKAVAAGVEERTVHHKVTPGPGLGRLPVNDSSYTVDLRSHRRPDLYSCIVDAKLLS